MKKLLLSCLAAAAGIMILSNCKTVENGDHDHHHRHDHGGTTTTTTTEETTLSRPAPTTVETQTTRSY